MRYLSDIDAIPVTYLRQCDINATVKIKFFDVEALAEKKKHLRHQFKTIRMKKSEMELKISGGTLEFGWKSDRHGAKRVYIWLSRIEFRDDCGTTFCLQKLL